MNDRIDSWGLVCDNYGAGSRFEIIDGLDSRVQLWEHAGAGSRFVS